MEKLGWFAYSVDLMDGEDTVEIFQEEGSCEYCGESPFKGEEFYRECDKYHKE